MSHGSEITDEDLATFKRDGFVLKKAMYTREEVSLLHDISKGEQYVAAMRPLSAALCLSYHGYTHSVLALLTVLTTAHEIPRARTGLGFALVPAEDAGRVPTSSSTPLGSRVSPRSTTSKGTARR